MRGVAVTPAQWPEHLLRRRRLYLPPDTTHFYACSTLQDGLQGWCKPCYAAWRDRDRTAPKRKYTRWSVAVLREVEHAYATTPPEALAARYDCTVTAIYRLAQKHGWRRDPATVDAWMNPGNTHPYPTEVMRAAHLVRRLGKAIREHDH
jgi:hypothetical protein